MRIEGVIVCVGYADFLAHTLPDNRGLFDKLVVVTTPFDRETQKVCEYWHVQVVMEHDLVPEVDEFHKGAGINAGLEQLERTDWLIHLDADVVLPPKTRLVLEQARLDPAKVYGCDRMNVLGFEAWQRFRALPVVQYEDDIWVHHGPFPTATRLANSSFPGYAPLGFFQMWNAASGVLEYPQGHTDAAREDILFAKKWPRDKRELLPELIVYHLESEPAPKGANWRGRTTVRFGPEPLCPLRTIPKPRDSESDRFPTRY